MIIVNLEQGSPEWLAARAVIPTASNFSRIMTPKTLKFSASAQKYAIEIVAARISGVVPDGYQSQDMMNGTDMEAEARSAFEFITDLNITQVGMVYQNQDKLYSCSPDGLAIGGLEIKCPIDTTQMGYILDNEVPGVYLPQIQGSLWITGLDYWDFFSYHQNYRHVLIRVYRDKKFIAAMAGNMDKFLDLIETTQQKLAA